MRKIIALLMPLVVIAGIMFLTLQGPGDTTELSETVRHWVMTLGINIEPHEIRHLVHFPMYFLLGTAFYGATRALGRSPAWAVDLGCFVGLFDEVLKIWLPTREFDAGDLVLDFVGVGVAVVVCWGITFLLKRDDQAIHIL